MTMTERPGEWVDTAPGLDSFTFTEYPMQVTTDRYVSREYAEREREAIWMRTWQVCGREEDLPEMGDWKEHQIYDQSYVIVRGKDGVLRGFVNACRHRGNKLCIGGKGNSNGPRIVCNYHLWSFNLDGSLARVFRPELVGELDIESLGLLPVSVDTFGGFIWMHPDPDAQPLAEYLGPMVELLTPYRMHEMTKVLDVREAIECNWKVVIDAFTEGYHIEGIHPELLQIIVIDPTKNRFNYFDEHAVACSPFEAATREGFTVEDQIEGIRQLPNTFPGVAEILPDFEDRVNQYRDENGVLDMPDGVTPRILLQHATRKTFTDKGLDVSGLTDAQMSDNHGYLLFPNFFMTIRAGEATVITAVPHPDGDPNRCIWHVTSYFWLQDEFAEMFRAEPIEVQNPGDYQYFLALDQDYVQMPRQQLGLRNSRLEYLQLAHEEIGIARFQAVVDRYMAEHAASVEAAR